jgi:GR25 family glycosyltransferase involved in LPS biosynthesis
MNLNELSKSIYVINLKERSDRRDHIIKELNKVECDNYILFDAVNGGEIPNNSRLTNGMFGLVSTYLNIYEHWKNNKTGNITIIEDDCVFVDDFNEKINNYIKYVPDNWDMIYFGGNHNKHMGIKTENINEYCLKLNHSFTAHCVILKDHVFEHLISEIKNFTIENDVVLANLQRVYNAYCSVNILATQIPNYSNIENRFVDYKHLIN